MKQEHILQSQQQLILYPTLQLSHCETYDTDRGGLLIMQKGCGDLHILHETMHLTQDECMVIAHHTVCSFLPLQPCTFLFLEWDEAEVIVQKPHSACIRMKQDRNLQACINLLMSETKQCAFHPEFMASLTTLLSIQLLRKGNGAVSFCLYKQNGLECRQVYNYLKQHCHRSISLEELAHLVHMNPSALAHRYKAYMGHPIGEDVTNLRLMHAQTLLQTKDDAINDIAAHCGFSSPSYFIQQFRKHFHSTPLQYRKSFRRLQKKTDDGNGSL